ncbi:MAG: tungsten-containing formaldehyde ferredoxin oxidoreductase [Thermoleophilia bacterium]
MSDTTRNTLPGYAGTLLRIDLTTGAVTKEPLPEKLAREYLGGRGFVAKLLWDEVPAGADPLGPENRVIMASGPLAGAFVPAGGKVEFGAKSPATGGYGDSNMGGHLAAEMKYAGYDVVVFQGAAERPVYLLIDDARVEIRDAARYWGLGSLAAEKALKDDLGEDFQIATIGPAGENLVRYACISHDFGRQAGRTGIGAVLGAKKVKAVAVRGSRSFPVADPARVMQLGKAMYAHCRTAPLFQEWQDFGTASVTTWVNEIGCFPTKNFSTSYYEKFERFSGQVMRESIIVTDKACFACPMACGKYSHTRVKTASGAELEAHVEGPEYETTALVGGNCLLDSIEEVAYANWVMDELGLDTISAGSTIAWALECIERGLITPDMVEGKELRFGDLESVLWLCGKIAAREGFIGNLLADGTRMAAEKIGGGSEKFAVQVKGLEMSGYDSRNATAMLLSYMTADIGAAHNRSWAVTHDLATERRGVEGKAAKVIELQHTRPMFDTLGVCRLQWIELDMPVERYAEMLTALTGHAYSWDDLVRISEKVWNLTRAFSAREIPGYGRAFDLPPARVWEDPVPTGPSAGAFVPLKTVHALLDEYYRLRGWDENGLPTAAKLRELGLDDVAEVLARP